mgnify:CR=1 FL=1|jgi:hypothetical protein
MSNTYFHNSKLANENKDKKKLPQIINAITRDTVDINILLNRVKIEEKNQIKQKIIFFCFTVLLLGSLGVFLAIIR